MKHELGDDDTDSHLLKRQVSLLSNFSKLHLDEEVVVVDELDEADWIVELVEVVVINELEEIIAVDLFVFVLLTGEEKMLFIFLTIQ